MHDLEFGFTPGVHAALVCILYLMTCFLLAPMTRYSTCSHALCSLPFWALSCYNTGKIPYLLKSACKAAKLHGNILPDSRTLQRCGGGRVECCTKCAYCVPQLLGTSSCTNLSVFYSCYKPGGGSNPFIKKIVPLLVCSGGHICNIKCA